MFCPKCGKENSDDAKFCQECGFEIEGIIKPVSSDIQESADSLTSPIIEKSTEDNLTHLNLSRNL